MDVIADTTFVAEPTDLQETKAKFMLLLETERNSTEFQRLYEEVNEALARLMQLERMCGAAGP